MPPKSRISNLLNNFDFSIDDDQDEASPVSQGESALNDLLSRSKKKEQSRFASGPIKSQKASSSVLQSASSSPGPLPPRSTSQRHIPSSVKSPDVDKGGFFQKLVSKKRNDLPIERNLEDETRHPTTTYSPVRRPSDRTEEYKSTGYQSGEMAHNSSFDYSIFCEILKQISFNPLFAKSSKNEQVFVPDSDKSTFELMLEDSLQDSQTFAILPLNVYEEKKDSVIKLRSKVQKIQNTLISTPSEKDTTLMIQLLCDFRDLELLILRHLSAVLAYQVGVTNFSIQEFENQLSSFKFTLQEKENVIMKLEDTTKKKEVIISSLEKKIARKKQTVGVDSDTDVEDEDIPKRRKKSEQQNFSISDKDVLHLASILKSLDPDLPYPTPSNILSSLSKLKPSTSLSNISKTDNDQELKGKIKKYKEEAENWKRRYESLNNERSGANDNQHATELKDLRAALKREAEKEVNAVTEQADREIKELQESFNARVRETETGYRKQIDDLKKKMESQERDIRSLRIENAESLQKNQSIANLNMDKMQQELEYQYKEQISDLERRLENLGLESAKILEKELEKLREAHAIEMSSINRRHKKELDKAINDGVNSKSRTHLLLEEAEINIEKIKEEAFRDKEEADEQIQALSRKIKELEDENRSLSSSLQQADSNYLKKLDQSRLQIDSLENQIKNLKAQVEVEKNNAETLKQDLRDKELYISELGKSIVEYQKLHQEFDSVESRYKIELQRKDEHIAGLDATIQKERAKSKQDLLEAAESTHEAMDQLDRIKRRLDATEQDLTRARSFSDEKESEILDLKRLIRSQNKQLETALGGPISNTPKLSKDDLESKIEILKTQITSLKRQLEYKEKESFEVRMESAEAYQKASQLDSAREEIIRLTSDLDKISQTLIELKSSKVQLLERVDNAEHRETLLKNEIALLKADIERNR